MLRSAHSEKPLRQKLCNNGDCGRLFFICSHCDRGQRYCSLACRLKSRFAQLRRARLRHRQSPEGREDQCRRQKDYRRRKADLLRASAALAENVMDQAPQAALTSSMILAPPGLASGTTPRPRFRSAFGWAVCQFCGRIGRFLDPFHEPG